VSLCVSYSVNINVSRVHQLSTYMVAAQVSGLMDLVGRVSNDNTNRGSLFYRTRNDLAPGRSDHPTQRRGTPE